MTKAIALGCAAMLLALAGCGREDAAQTGSSSATRPSATRPTTVPAEPVAPAVSVLKINGQTVLFPPACLRLEQRDGIVWAKLFSDDPPPEVKEPFVENFYYFDMPLDITDPAELTTTYWAHKSASSEEADSPNGVFLKKMTEHLQPYDVRVVFSQEGGQVSARISGQFLLFRAAAAQPQMLVVDGTVVATPKVK